MASGWESRSLTITWSWTHGPWLMCELTRRQHVATQCKRKRQRQKRQQHGQPPKGHFTHETEGPWALHLKHSHWWKRWSRSKFSSHYAWGTNGVSKWMQKGCKIYMYSCMVSNLSCFMATWIIFKNHLLEVGLTQNRETIDLLYLIMCEDPARIEINRNSIRLRAQSHTTSH